MSGKGLRKEVVEAEFEKLLQGITPNSTLLGILKKVCNSCLKDWRSNKDKAAAHNRK